MFSLQTAKTNIKVRSKIYIPGTIILHLDKIYSVTITEAKTSQILICAI